MVDARYCRRCREKWCIYFYLTVSRSIPLCIFCDDSGYQKIFYDKVMESDHQRLSKDPLFSMWRAEPIVKKTSDSTRANNILTTIAYDNEKYIWSVTVEIIQVSTWCLVFFCKILSYISWYESSYHEIFPWYLRPSESNSFESLCQIGFSSKDIDADSSIELLFFEKSTSSTYLFDFNFIVYRIPRQIQWNQIV